jgi:hypothetical protein
MRAGEAPPFWTGGADRPGGADRIALFVSDGSRLDGTVSIRTGRRGVNIAAPVLPNGVTAVALTLWPDGQINVSTCIFALPIGSSWDPNLRDFPVGRIARALALAAPMVAVGVDLEEVPDQLIADVAYAKWVDPVLGALAFHARDQKRQGISGPGLLDAVCETIRGNMTTFFWALPDSRIIAALDPDPTTRRLHLSPLLDDAGLGQPVLTASLAALANAAIAAGRLDHWAVERLDRIPPGQVFNAIRTDE